MAAAGGSRWVSQADLGFAYRSSGIRDGEVVAGAELELAPRPAEEIKATVATMQAQRKAAQPTNKRTFGSVFANPEGHELTAGRMLEACGLKGYRIGGAQISPRHANFIENAGDARSADALALMAEARRRALAQFGVELVARCSCWDRWSFHRPASSSRPPPGRRRGPRGEVGLMEGRAPGRTGVRVVSQAARLTAEHRSVARLLPSGRSLAVGAVLVLGAVLAYVAARETPVFALRAVTVEGAPAPVAAEVQSALAPLVGSSLVTLDGRVVVARVEALPTVVSASYDRDFPHRLALVVRPERPVAVLRQGSAAWLVSARGRVMRSLEPGTERSLPRIWVGRGAGDRARCAPGWDAGPDRGSTGRAGIEPAVGQGDHGPPGGGAPDADASLRAHAPLRAARQPRPQARSRRARAEPTVPNAGAGGYLDVTVPDRPVADFNSQPEG